MKDESRLVVVSNRVPAHWEDARDGSRSKSAVGGLVSGLQPAMEESGGLWFGWSGRSTQRRSNALAAVSRFGPVELATVDLSEDDTSLYYTGFANRTLWPLLHSFPARVVIRGDTFRAYRRVNRRFAEILYPMLRPGDLVWIHDYHLFHVGEELRQIGWEGSMGFFLHVPFPPSDIFGILPWAEHLLQSLAAYDLVGVQTDHYLHNLTDALRFQLGLRVSNGMLLINGRSTRLGVYAIGIEPSIFQQLLARPEQRASRRHLIPVAAGQHVLLGVDRLDYTKGIPERLRTFERLLEQHPSLRGRTTFVQISSPSRTRVPEYIEEKERIERLVGQINGRFSEGGWVPIRYLYRSYPRAELAQFYRDADVCVVTPLRDGMNLVAKEFVASQGEDPGVLLLSKFSGAASTMHDALVVNPYDIDGTAEATYRAIRMSASERRDRWRSLMDEVCTNTARSWSEAFCSDLSRATLVASSR